MKNAMCTVLVLAGLGLSAAHAATSATTIAQTQWSFNADRAGSIPAGWAIAETSGRGAPAVWKVVRDASAASALHAVALVESKNQGRTFNLLLREGASFGDLSLSVRVKAVSGREDQGGGPLWRARDENNYYIARWNPLEKNFRLYYVKDGVRKQLASADVDAATSAWHRIDIEHRGDRITAGMDGKRLIDVRDATFSSPGAVGLWTKADACSEFDDVIVKSPAP